MPPAGPMVPHVGPQLTVDEIITGRAASNDGLEEPVPRSLLERVRAFHVPALEGVTFVCEREAFEAALFEALHARLPGTSWFALPGVLADALVEKYWLLDASIVAPRDDATGQAMWLDLMGRVTNPGVEWEPGASWGPVVQVRIDTAVWTNVGRLRIDAPLYL